MRHENRRKELGRMLMDIAKYLATVGLVGSILTNNLTLYGGIIIAGIVALLVIIAFYTIPPKEGG